MDNIQKSVEVRLSVVEPKSPHMLSQRLEVPEEIIRYG